MADKLDLQQRGPAQMDRVVVNPTSVRAEDYASSDGARFLAQIERLSGTVGGVLAQRAAARRAEEEKQLTEQARLKATNPVEWQRRLAAGEVKESDHPVFHRSFNVYAAQDAAAKAEAEFRSFDVESNDDDAVTDFAAQTRQKYLTGNDSVIYQGSMAEALNGMEANLRARRQQVVSAQQTEKTYLNFQASLHDSMLDAIRQGQPAAVAGVVAQQLDRGVAGGLSLSKLLNNVREAAVEAVYEDPSVAKELAAIPLPHVGPGATLGSFASDDLSTAEANAIDRQERKLRLAITQQEAGERRAARAARRAAASEIFQSGNVSEETQNALLQTDPEFALKLPAMIEKAEAQALNLSPEYTALKTDVVLRRVPPERLEMALDTDEINLKQYDELSKLADKAEADDVTKKPVYKMGASSVTRTLKTLEKSLTEGLQGDVMGSGKVTLTPQQSLAVESARSRIEFGYRDRVAELMEEGQDAASAVKAAAAEAREAAVAEYEQVAADFGLGAHSGKPVAGPIAPVAQRTKAPPQVAREAQENLSPNGIAALDKLGGFGSRAKDVNFIQEAIATFSAHGSLTPWARDKYEVFRANNVDIKIDEVEFLQSLFYSAYQQGASGSE